MSDIKLTDNDYEKLCNQWHLLGTINGLIEASKALMDKAKELFIQINTNDLVNEKAKTNAIYLREASIDMKKEAELKRVKYDKKYPK